MQCTVHKQDHVKRGRQIKVPRCYGRITLIVDGRLKTQPKFCNSKKPKYEWSDENVFADYLDVRNYAIPTHNCTKSCLKGCILKHNCEGRLLPRDRKRTYMEVARNHNLKNPSLEIEKSVSSKRTKNPSNHSVLTCTNTISVQKRCSTTDCGTTFTNS